MAGPFLGLAKQAGLGFCFGGPRLDDPAVFGVFGVQGFMGEVVIDAERHGPRGFLLGLVAIDEGLLFCFLLGQVAVEGGAKAVECWT